MKISIPPEVEKILDRLNQKGHEAYVVGGCVRDALLHKPADDWDVCTSALPDEMIAIFSDYKIIPTGIPHGTVTVLAGTQGVEVTTFRKDGRYTDHRHPDQVDFSRSISDDLARRDFTVNAMAYHPRQGLVDQFGGREDLAKKIIRCVGDPQKRFHEDALRVLRGLRFAAVLGFEIEDNTRTAIKDSTSLLEFVAPERIRQELDKLLCGINAGKIIRQYHNELKTILPYWTLSPEMLGNLDQLPAKPAIRLAFLYQGNLRVAEALRQLRYPKSTINNVTAFCRWLQVPLPLTLPAVRGMYGALGEKNTKLALNLLQSMNQEAATGFSYLEQIQRENLCCSLKELNIDGSTLLSIGIPPGREVGEMLDKLLNAVIHEDVDNSHQALVAYAKAIKKS